MKHRMFLSAYFALVFGIVLAACGDDTSSSGPEGGENSAVAADTTKITYALKRFDGPLSNPHKGFTVPEWDKEC